MSQPPAKPSAPKNSRNPKDDALRPHVYDGITEFDKRLPNWWLWTLYGAIIFSLGYWFIMHQAGADFSPEATIATKLARLQAEAAARATGPLSDDQMWALSQNPDIVASGKSTFLASCAPCHGENLQGGIGFNLADNVWVHGGNPSDIIRTITNGVPEKGMQAWGSQLGERKIQEVAAFILSHHKKPSSSP